MTGNGPVLSDSSPVTNSVVLVESIVLWILVYFSVVAFASYQQAEFGGLVNLWPRVTKYGVLFI